MRNLLVLRDYSLQLARKQSMSGRPKMSAVDLRSDTVTRPSATMRARIASAAVGDDVMQDDPTVKELEDRVALMFHKEAALFFPSGTMSNLAAVLCHCQQRGSEMICGDNSHMFLWEQAGAAQFGGVSPRTVKNNNDGTFSLDEVRLAVRPDDVHEPITRLICIENTHNSCGGRILPLSFLQGLRSLADEFGLPVHLDGARLWNAITAVSCQPHEFSQHVDSLSVCLSKGLGAPVGSVLVGSKAFVALARRIRKALGGGMRQSGILAAAGLQALDDFEKGILTHDHVRAKALAAGLRGLAAFSVDEKIIDTNIIFASLPGAERGFDSDKVKALLKEKGVLVSAWAPQLIRLVVHRDIDDDGIARAIAALKEVSMLLCG